MNNILNLKKVLTPREIEVAQCMVKGMSNIEIAECLIISDHTAKFHVSSILQKLNVKTRAAACYLFGKYEASFYDTEE